MVIYIYGYREFVKGFCYFWMGVFYSVLFFIEIVFDYLIDFFYDLDVMDILIMVSIVVYCFRVLIVRLCCKFVYEIIFFIFEEFFFFLGFLLGIIGIMYFVNMLIIILVVISYLIVFYLKLSIVMLSVVVFCLIGSIYFFLVSNVNYNLFILFVFCIYFVFELVIDMYFLRFFLIEFWKIFIFL